MVFREDQHLLVLMLFPHETSKGRDLRIGARIYLAEPFKQARNSHDVCLESREQILLSHKSRVEELHPTLLSADLLVCLFSKSLKLLVGCVHHPSCSVNAEMLTQTPFGGVWIVALWLFVSARSIAHKVRLNKGAGPDW